MRRTGHEGNYFSSPILYDAIVFYFIFSGMNVPFCAIGLSNYGKSWNIPTIYYLLITVLSK